MRVNITVAVITSVRIAVRSVKTILGYAVHGTLPYLHPLLLLRKAQCRARWDAYVRGERA
jgi:hypothetical protein